MAHLKLIMKNKKSSEEGNEYQEVSDQQLMIPTRIQHVWFAIGCITVLISIAKSILLTYNSTISIDHDRLWSRPWIELTFAVFVGYIISDFASGIFHWVFDNYGSPKTPIFGPQIKAAQLHHRKPWVFTTRPLSIALYIQAITITLIVMPVNLLCSDPIPVSFMGVLSGCLLFSQQFHMWAHIPKRKLPLAVVALQDVGVVLGRSHHTLHHRSPHNISYCIVNGIWNGFLDRIGFFLGLEWMIFFVVGVQQRSWTAPEGLDWSN